MNCIHIFIPMLILLLEKLLPGPLYFFTSTKIPAQLSARNRKHNEAIPCAFEPILNQKAEPVCRFSIGSFTASYNGCASIALFNALLCKDCPLPLPELIFRLENTGCLSLKGRLGTNPFRLGRVLKTLPICFERFRKLSDLENALSAQDAAILVIWNDRNAPQKGAHFFTVRKLANGYEMYNRLAQITCTDSLSDIIGNGRFITGYRIY